jgi:hypothetical protein
VISLGCGVAILNRRKPASIVGVFLLLYAIYPILRAVIYVGQ